MEPDEQSDDARDSHTFAVADHGVNPAAMPPVAVAAPASADGPDGTDGASRATHKAGGGDSGRLGLRDVLVWCGIPALIVLLLNVFLVGFYEIPSGSMLDTIEIGDRVVTSRIAPRVPGLKRGDVVVFHDPANWLSNERTGPLRGDYLIKRLIGLPGDTVACAGAGSPVIVNGVAIDEGAYLKPGVNPSSFPFEVTVTPGHVFVLGDNRDNSADSRYHADDGDGGLVPESKVVGVAFARYWPFNRLGLIDAHHEVFAQVPDPGEAGGSR